MNLKEYNHCIDKHSDGIFRFLFSLCKDHQLAQDLCQDVFEKVWMRCDSIILETAKSYLFRTAHNCFVDHYRRNKFQSPQEIDQLPISYEASESNWDTQHWLHQGLLQLSENQKSAILLRDYEGYSYQEIADILEISLVQTKVEIFRGRKKLQRFIGKKEVLI
ncbi:MAG: RNA polymerase sigma factor (sigma-70 family) [Luteibaculaceae bacterium]|jgi:RNA polymerase sigma factor (sigma-70 family)